MLGLDSGGMGHRAVEPCATSLPMPRHLGNAIGRPTPSFDLPDFDIGLHLVLNGFQFQVFTSGKKLQKITCMKNTWFLNCCKNVIVSCAVFFRWVTLYLMPRLRNYTANEVRSLHWNCVIHRYTAPPKFCG